MVASHQPVLLDLSQLGKGLRNTQTLGNRHSWGYHNEFNIQSSWVGRSETLRHSMLVYTKKMSDIRRIRGLNVLKQQYQPEVMPSFEISATRASLELKAMEDSARRFYAANNRLARSLGTIKLEPLLGSQRSLPSKALVNSNAFKTYKVKADEQRQSSTRAQENSKELVKENTKPIRHIKVTISIPPIDLQEGDEDEDVTQNHQPRQEDKSEEVTSIPSVLEDEEADVVKGKHKPLLKIPKRVKNDDGVKLTRPKLEAITEDPIKDIDTEKSSKDDLEHGYHRLLDDISQSHVTMLEQKRQAVALLRQTNYSQKSLKEQRQMTLMSHAKRKLKKLPLPAIASETAVVAPVEEKRPLLRYTNGNYGAKFSSLYFSTQTN